MARKMTGDFSIQKEGDHESDVYKLKEENRCLKNICNEKELNLRKIQIEHEMLINQQQEMANQWEIQLAELTEEYSELRCDFNKMNNEEIFEAQRQEDQKKI